MQQVQNVFVSGLNKDSNPVSVDNKTLTDALNATTITFHGNEGLLQNDLGNTNLTYYPKVYNSEDGTNTSSDLCKLVSLPKGYTPIGMKECGDIVYIVSHHPISKETEIGSFPGPDFDLPSINAEEYLSEEIILTWSVKQDCDDCICEFISPIYTLGKDKKYEVGDIVTITYNSNLNENILSTKDQKKILKLSFINLKTNADITDKINAYFCNVGQSSIQFKYPNIESGFLGLRFILENPPTIQYTGYNKFTKEWVNDTLFYRIYFNSVKVHYDSYVKVSKINVNLKLESTNDIPYSEEIKINGPSSLYPNSDYSEFYFKNNTEELPIVISFPKDKVTNNLKLTITFQPIIDYIDYQDNYVNYPETIFPTCFYQMDAINFVWDMQYDISMLNYLEVEETEFNQVQSSYYQIIENERTLDQVLYELAAVQYQSEQPVLNVDSLTYLYYNNQAYFDRCSLQACQFESDTEKQNPLQTILNKNMDCFKQQGLGTVGSAAMLFDTAKLGSENKELLPKYDKNGEELNYDKFHINELRIQGKITPNLKLYLKTNLFGDNINNFINNNSYITYPENKNKIGIISFPGGPAGASSDCDNRTKVLGEINNWPIGQNRINYSNIIVNINNKTVDSVCQKIIIKTQDYLKDVESGNAQRQFNEVSPGFVSLSNDWNTIVTPYKTNTNNIWFGKADTFYYTNINYSIIAQGITPDFGEIPGKGMGSNGLLVCPTIGGFIEDPIDFTIQPLILEKDIELNTNNVQIPQNKNINIDYIIPYLYNNGIPYKEDRNKIVLLNQDDIIKKTYPKLGMNISKNNTIKYTQYLINSDCVLPKLPLSGYYTFACFSNVASTILKDYGQEIGASSLYHISSKESFTMPDNTKYYLHIYLIKDGKYEFKNFSSKNSYVLNPIYYPSNFMKWDSAREQYIKIDPNEDTVIEKYNSTNIYDKVIWSDSQVMKVNEIVVHAPQKTDYYFEIAEQGEYFNPDMLERKYIYNIYIPEPLYDIDKITYNTENNE